MPARPRLALLGVMAAPGLALLTACASNPEPAGAGADSVAVSATDKTCQVARTNLDSGATTFTVSNDGAKVTEVYVYARQGGAFSKVVGEVENIGPGTSRDLSVELAPGAYQLACKPGQSGTGIRQDITVTGAGAQPSTEAAYDREVRLSTDGSVLRGLRGATATNGEQVELTLANNSARPRTLEVKAPDSSVAGEVEVEAGGEGELVVELDRKGSWLVVVEGGRRDLRTAWRVG